MTPALQFHRAANLFDAVAKRINYLDSLDSLCATRNKILNAWGLARPLLEDLIREFRNGVLTNLATNTSLLIVMFEGMVERTDTLAKEYRQVDGYDESFGEGEYDASNERRELVRLGESTARSAGWAMRACAEYADSAFARTINRLNAIFESIFAVLESATSLAGDAIDLGAFFIKNAIPIAAIVAIYMVTR